MSEKVLTFGFAFLLPSVITLLFSKKFVDSNARRYPWLYTGTSKTLTLLGSYASGVIWLLAGINFLFQ
jgi:hypothetical protein